jgi:hypothetical protein
MIAQLTPQLAEKFAQLALSHIGREYPNKLDHVMGSERDVLGPRALHPIFFGSLDWHSCVHGYWLLARALRRFPDIPSAASIAAQFSERFTPTNVATECAYVERAHSRAFERPYGWAWLLALQSELDLGRDRAVVAAARTLEPLSTAFAARFAEFLPLADYPIRSGVHASTAFALRMSADYAQTRSPALFAQMAERAQHWYGADTQAAVWEPSQEDFLSPTLIEAECMRRFLPHAEFITWFEQFLPSVTAGRAATLLQPARVSARHDDKIAHLDGLNLSRAWCWRSLAVACGPSAVAYNSMLHAAAVHLAASLPHIAGDYMGEHWLATFAMLALDA